MKLRKTLLLLLCLLPMMASLLGTLSLAKPEFAKKESKACTYCHVKLGAKELNDTGKYYKEHGYSMEGYKAPK